MSFFIRLHSRIIMFVLMYIFICLWFWQFRSRLRMKNYAVFPVAAIGLCICYASGAAMAMLESWSFRSFRSMSLFGGILFMPPLTYLGAKLTKREPAAVLDVFSLGGVIGLFFLRINCLISGCCYGNVISWYPKFRYPVREIEMLFFFLFFNFVGDRTLKNKTHGEVCGLLMLCYGILRFFLQFLRFDNKAIIWEFSFSHIMALISIAVGAAWYFGTQGNQVRKAGDKS